MRLSAARALLVSVLVFAASCSHSPAIESVPAAISDQWRPVQSDSQVATIRQTFPDYLAERVKPGTDHVQRSTLTPDNFLPARFFGVANPRGWRSTTNGIRFESNGYEAPQMPVLLQSPITYFGPDQQPFTFPLTVASISVLRKIEERMGLPVSLDANPILLNKFEWRVDPNEVDRIFLEVRQALATRLPQVRNVDWRNCEVVIEPSIFYVRGSNFGDTWASGLTVGGSPFRIHAAVYYINSQRVQVDWRLVLIDEVINFYVLSIGRADLAR